MFSLHHDELARPAAHQRAHDHRADLGDHHRTGLTVQAAYDPEWYAKGVKISDTELAAVPLVPHDFHGEWNYTINAHTDLS